MSDVLDQVRAKLSQPRSDREPDPWRPPLLEEFYAPGTVLTFDPTLSNTGWVYFAHARTRLVIMGKGTLRPRTDRTGYEANWDKASQLFAMLRSAEMQEPMYGADLVAWEAPAIYASAGGMRTDSSETAGLMLRLACGRSGKVITPRHASSVFIGNPDHDKAQVKEAVARYVPEADGRGWNEHQRDALLIGLACLWDLAHPQTGK